MAIFCIFLFATLPVVAQEVLAKVKTASGCDAFVPDWWLKKSNVRFTWDGQCVDGLATGWGKLVATGPDGGNEYEGWRVEGRLFGYRIFRLGGPPHVITFSYNNQSVSLMAGMGLEISEESLKSPSVVLPRIVPSSPRHHYQSIQSPLGEAEISPVRCSQGTTTYPKNLLAYCNLGYPKGWNLPYYAVTVKSPQGKREEFICDDFEKFESCARIADGVAADIRASILDFIAKAKPAVDATLAQADAQAKLASRRESERRAQDAAAAHRAREDEAKRLAQVEEAARFNRETEALKLRARMDTASAGELFAMADELKEKGDSVNARTALRRFVARFPDHKLAELAAKMLRELP